MRLHQLMPPPELIEYASGSCDEESFRGVGIEFLNYFRDLCRLRPSARVLDLGCACGRMALPLAGYLDRTGSYEGVDIHGPSIDWASDNISVNFPNFRFQKADVANPLYNPHGKVAPHRYRLPFADGSFDFVFLTSVFTHMLPSALENYLREIVRVLRVGGRCLSTFFVLNDRTAEFIRTGKSCIHFPFRFGSCAVQSAEQPEQVIAYFEPAIKQLLKGYGMRMHCPILVGKWCGDPDGLSFQDLIITQKTRLANWKSAVRRLTALRPDRPHFVVDDRYTLRAA